MTSPSLLVVDDKPNFLSLFQRLFNPSFAVSVAADGRQALALLERQGVDVVLSDVRMPGLDGVGLLREVKRRWPHTEVILLTAFGEISQAVAAMKEGAFDYLQKPIDLERAEQVVQAALARRRERTAEPLERTYREVLESARETAARAYLIELLRLEHGNVTHAADRAELERESFHRLMRKFGLRAEDYRPR